MSEVTERIEKAEAAVAEALAEVERVSLALALARSRYAAANEELHAARVEADAQLPCVTVTRLGFESERWTVRRTSKTSIWASPSGSTHRPTRFAVNRWGDAEEYGRGSAYSRRRIPRKDALRILGEVSGE